MSIEKAKQTLKAEQELLIKQAAKIGRAIQLLENGSEAPQLTFPKRKRKMSAAGRKAIQEGAKKYWAAKRKASTPN